MSANNRGVNLAANGSSVQSWSFGAAFFLADFFAGVCVRFFALAMRGPVGNAENGNDGVAGSAGLQDHHHHRVVAEILVQRIELLARRGDDGGCQAGVLAFTAAARLDRRRVEVRGMALHDRFLV